MNISGITGSLGISRPSNDFSPLSVQTPTSSSPPGLQDGIDHLKTFNLDDMIVYKGGKQSTTINCPEGTEPVAVKDGNSMTVTCEKPPTKKDDAVNSPSGTPIIK